MPFSWDRTWGDVVAMARAHLEVLLVVAGVFILLPGFAVALYVAQPVGRIETLAEATRVINAYFAANWLPLLLASVATRMGEATILAVLLNDRRQTVSQSLALAAKLLFPFVLLNLIMNFAFVAGLFIFIIPGVYLIGRLAVAAPAMIADRDSNPLGAIARSLALSRGKGWAITGLVVLVVAVAYIVNQAIRVVFKVLLVFVIPRAAITEVTALVAALLDASVTIVAIVLTAAIYRQLVGAGTRSRATPS